LTQKKTQNAEERLTERYVDPVTGAVYELILAKGEAEALGKFLTTEKEPAAPNADE
jgi:hypothetical protein